jgi:CRISPR-associated protein Cas2
MLVVIANDLPPAVRGRMKLWFVEPRANMFVSGIKDSVAKKVVDYLHKYCPSESGLMIFNSNNKAPGYEIYGLGDTRKDLIELSGMQLVIEKSTELLPPTKKITEP